jgi:uncharacterized protein YfiM (DUF2279 family)
MSFVLEMQCGGNKQRIPVLHAKYGIFDFFTVCKKWTKLAQDTGISEGRLSEYQETVLGVNRTLIIWYAYSAWLDRASRGIIIHRMLRYFLLSFLISSVMSAQYNPAQNDTVDQYDSLRIAPEMQKQMSDPWFARDKVLHFSAGFAIPGLTYHFYVNRLNRDEQRGKVYAVSLTALLAVGKELYDKKKKGHFSWKDLMWSGLGLAAGYLVFVY